MSYWPTGMTVDPIGAWPGALSSERKRSPFDSTLSATMTVLRRELWALDAAEVRMQVAIPASQFRLDGFPRATAKAEHPGVILTMKTKVGALSYPCDTFLTWEDNLRAIALALEALRKVDRYGVTRGGEQYRGFLAIEGGAELHSGFTSVKHAAGFIESLIATAGWTTIPGDIPTQLRQAKRLTHPDMGGTNEDFQLVMDAERYLTANGAI